MNQRTAVLQLIEQRKNLELEDVREALGVSLEEARHILVELSREAYVIPQNDGTFTYRVPLKSWAQLQEEREQRDTKRKNSQGG